jgi:hypothetical protein
LLLLDRAGQVGGSMEHSEGKGGESDVAIMGFLCGSPCLCRLRTALFCPRWQVLSCVLTARRAFMGPNKLSSFCNYFVEPHLPASCNAFTYRGRMRPRAKTSSQEQGGDFDLVGTCEWCISIRVTVTLSVMSVSLPLQPSRSMIGVLLWSQGFGYEFGYDHVTIMIIVFTYL